MGENLRKLDRHKVYLVTGAAGFIGFHLSRRLLSEGCTVIGLDNRLLRRSSKKTVYR